MTQPLPRSTRIIQPPPPNYAANFAKGGHRLVERLYRCRTDMHVKWQAMLGGLPELQLQRAAVKRAAQSA